MTDLPTRTDQSFADKTIAYPTPKTLRGLAGAEAPKAEDQKKKVSPLLPRFALLRHFPLFITLQG